MSIDVIDAGLHSYVHVQTSCMIVYIGPMRGSYACCQCLCAKSRVSLEGYLQCGT